MTRILTADKFIQPPLFETKPDWKLPRDLPNLKHAKILGLDTETRDPQLKEKGPGVRRDGKVIGISCAVPEGQRWYIPFGHAHGPQFDKAMVVQWAKDNLCSPSQPKVGANILYDLDYLTHEGVNVTGPYYDIQVAEPLIDENALSYSLDTLAIKYLGEHKQQTILEDACRDWGFKGAPQQHLWRLDPKYTGFYAESDAEQALRIFEKQKVTLKEEGLERVFDIETRLIPMLLRMRQVGVRIDTEALVLLHSKMKSQLKEEISKLSYLSGVHVDIWAAESIAKAFDKLGMSYPRTDKKQAPSFKKGWLESHNSDLAKQIAKCRELDKFIGTFLEGSLLEMLVGDRIHCQFNQLRSDEFGTVSGRFSSSNPNLQFIPTRTALGKECRKLFIPEKEFLWGKCDYSQVEIRILSHYARGVGSSEVVAAFINDPKLDYHQWCADSAEISRTYAKKINFGLIYGMGDDKLADELSIEPSKARDFKRDYFVKLPFLKETVQAATDTASRSGHIKTILGRRRRFNLWEAEDFELAKILTPKASKTQVEKEVKDYISCHRNIRFRSGVKRAGCYKAFNAADQGSAADIMKLAMVDIWESGICEEIIPYITVHDELDFGFERTERGLEAVSEVKRLMENTYKLKVPLLVDPEIGLNWGSLEKL